MSLKRKCFSVEEKMKIIRRMEEGERNIILSKEFCVCRTTIATIRKNKEKIKALFNSNVLKTKRFRASTQDQVDKALLQWFLMERSRGTTLSNSLLQEKANFFAKEFKIENFNCSVSWISRFKVRNNINFGKVSGETLSIQKSDVSEWPTKVWPKEEMDEYVLSDNCVAICEEPFEDSIVIKEELEEYVPIENGVAVYGKPSEHSIGKNILEDGQDSDYNVEDQNEAVSEPSVLEALKAAEILNRFVHLNFNDESLKHSASRLNSAVRDCFYISKTTGKQLKITDYFN